MADAYIEPAVINQVRRKNEDETLSTPYYFGANFRNIVDDRVSQEGYTLAQFFDNYMDFMTHTTFVHAGDTPPTNNHIGIWIDTSHDNKDQLGIEE